MGCKKSENFPIKIKFSYFRLTNVYDSDILIYDMKNMDLQDCTGFDWDKHNSCKNWDKHLVDMNECEEIFFNQPLIVLNDIKHSKLEKRFYSLGKTDTERKLFVVFTIRNNLICIISARDMAKKEKMRYKNYEKENT